MNLIQAARNYESFFNAFIDNPLAHDFIYAKELFKQLIYKFKAGGGLPSSLEGKLKVCLNPNGKDRIVKKVKRFFNKKEKSITIKSDPRRERTLRRVEAFFKSYEGQMATKNLKSLTQSIQAYSGEISRLYSRVDAALWITKDNSIINHRDFRAAKEAYMACLKQASQEQLPTIQSQLSKEGLDAKTIAKVDTIGKKKAAKLEKAKR